MKKPKPAVPSVSNGLASIPKPRLTFFRTLNNNDVPDYILYQFRDQVRCLEQFFEVTVVHENCDYDEVVDRTRPELSLFESGVYTRAGRSITNTHRHPGIPKVGFLHSDGYCLTRSVFLSDMDLWGVETFFAHAVTAVGYTPELADSTYAWPNFADRSVFHDYGDDKTEIILLSGSRAAHYPWRSSVDRLLRERFPVRSTRHGGWANRADTAGMPMGADYARSLAAALIVPTCGTIAQEFVRKYVEIPASGALLLAERTPAAEAAGFVDMENCVFSDPSEVVDKVEYLLANPDVLARVAGNGQALAHARHSIEHRDQLRQWFDLNRTKAPGQRIVQPGLFDALGLDAGGADAGGVSVALPATRDRVLVAEGRTMLAEAMPASGADRFAEVLGVHFEPEAALGLARAWLRLGRTEWARTVVDYSVWIVTAHHGATHPDPVEWAWALRIRLCTGELTTARLLASRYPTVRHPELDRTRAVVAGLGGDSVLLAAGPRHLSVHSDHGLDTWQEWIGELISDLQANGRGDLAERVGAVPDPTQFIESSAEVTVPARKVGGHVPLVVARTFQDGRIFAQRASRRLRLEAAKLRGTAAPPQLPSFQRVLGGRVIDTAIGVLIADDVADELEQFALESAAGVNVVRLGRTRPPFPDRRFRAVGLRAGVDDALLGRIPDLGRSVVVVSELAADLIDVSHLARTELLIILGGAETAVERRLAQDPSWRALNDETIAGFAETLHARDLRVWDRVGQIPSSGSAEPDTERFPPDRRPPTRGE